MFSNAFLRTDGLPVLDLLVGLACYDVLSARQVRRQIERWQTKAFALRIFEALGVENAYSLEELLLRDDPDRIFPGDRPHLFDRMVALGEPAIAKQLANASSRTSLWIRKALTRDEAPREVLNEITWRLLDPAPMSHVEWMQLAELQFKSIKLPIRKKPRVWVVRVPHLTGGQEMTEHHVSSEDEETRVGLMRVLLALRMAEVRGDLVSYYLNLLEAIDRCNKPGVQQDLALLQPECARFLASCFGRVHVGFPTFNIGYQRIRLTCAAIAFLELKQQPAGRVSNDQTLEPTPGGARKRRLGTARIKSEAKP